MPESMITTDMLIAALEEASLQSRQPIGLSVLDILEKLNGRWGVGKIRSLLRPMVASGKVVVVRELRPSLDGSMRWVPTYVYRRTQQEPEKKSEPQRERKRR